MDKFKQIARESATVEEALNALAQAGATPMYAIMALNRGRGVPLAAAKEAISKSSCWPDWDVTQDTLVEELENMDDARRVHPRLAEIKGPAKCIFDPCG